jgi:hypothetical protein
VGPDGRLRVDLVPGVLPDEYRGLVVHGFDLDGFARQVDLRTAR